jgi:hypothetical protein
VSRKPDAIDIVKLSAEGDHKMWNRFLTKCLKAKDINRLCTTREQLQRGMDKAAKENLNSEKIQLLFLRLQSSIENTIKAIIRKKYPNPCDNPLTAKDNSQWLEVKRARDAEMERYLRKTSY